MSFSQRCSCQQVWLWQLRLRVCQESEQRRSEPVCPGPYHHRCPQRPPGQAYWTGEDTHCHISTLCSLCCVIPFVQRVPFPHSLCLSVLQAHCFEEENVSLECQIIELEEKLNSQQASSSVTSTVAVPDYSLDAVVERLRKQRVRCCRVCQLRVSLCDGMSKLTVLMSVHMSLHLISLHSDRQEWLVNIHHCVHCAAGWDS